MVIDVRAGEKESFCLKGKQSETGGVRSKVRFVIRDL